MLCAVSYNRHIVWHSLYNLVAVCYCYGICIYTLAPGEYDFHFQIPANTLSNGEYTIVLDVAERNVKNYAGEETKLTFRVDVDEESNINAFSENIDIKSSIIREMWLKDYKLIKS